MTKPPVDMITKEFPIDFTYTEDLRSDLLSHVHIIETRFSLILNIGYQENSRRPYIKNYDEECERINELQGRFNDECRDNYLRIDDKRMADRYRKLLREYFNFLAGAKEMLNTNRERFYKEIIGEHEHDEKGDLYREWVEENEGTYFDSLLYWSSVLEDDYLDKAQNTVNEYDSRLIEFWKLDIVTISDADITNGQKSVLMDLGVKLQWRGNVTDLAELVWVMVKTGLILNKETSRQVTIDELGSLFRFLFGIEKLDVDGLVSKRIINTNKPGDGKMFMDTLRKLIESHPGWDIARKSKY